MSKILKEKIEAIAENERDILNKIKSDYATKEEVGNIKMALNIKVVTELPESDDGSIMYLVPTGASGEDNAYDEFIYNNGAWEKIGSTSVEADMSEYLKAPTKTADYICVLGQNEHSEENIWVQADASGGVTIYPNRKLMTVPATDNEISKRGNGWKPITPTNLDLAVKTGVTTNTIPLTEEEKASACEWLGVNALVGDVETTLDNIIAIQNQLIGGEA